MKSLNKIVIAVFLLVTFNVALAQNPKSQFIINATGKVLTDKGIEVGWIENDGSIKNAQGVLVGKIVGSKVLDKMGNKIAEVSSDGSLKDGKGKIIYTVLTTDASGNCKIVDASGKEVAKVHENYKMQGSCAFHCLKNFK